MTVLPTKIILLCSLWVYGAHAIESCRSKFFSVPVFENQEKKKYFGSG